MSFKRRNGAPQRAIGAGESLFEKEWTQALDSVIAAASSDILESPRTLLLDARKLTEGLARNTYSAVITSPPYCNRMSYVRELRPYMYWMGYLADGRSAGELDWQAIGGTWGIATSNVAKWEPREKIEVPFDELREIVRQVSDSSEVLGRYVAKYFHDVVLHARELVEVVESGGWAHYIVGNSKFYDIVVPTERIYAAVFEAVGFKNVSIRTLRKRTSKRELYEYLVSAQKH